VLTFPGICRVTEYDARVKQFIDRFAPAFDGAIHGRDEEFFPFVKFIGDIALIGLNSIARWSAMKNPLGSNGEVDDMQYDRLERILGDSRLQGRRLFILAHHHFHSPKYPETCSMMGRVWQRVEGHTLKLHKRKRLLELFKLHGVEKILHGHVHEHTEYRQGGVTCLNAGASMLPAGEEERKYHLIGAETRRVEKIVIGQRPPELYRPPNTKVRMPRYIFST
jgi:predicted phosphodiesterase